MSITDPLPSFDEVLASFGRAGQRLSAISATEGAAGNISACIAWPLEVRRRFPTPEPLTLPEPVPALAKCTLVVTGSGRRLQEAGDDPEANLGVVVIDENGATATMWSSPRRRFVRLTSELNSHLAAHADRVGRTDANFHAIIHAQPLHLTLLSHISEYRVGDTMTRRLLRWEPETILSLPEGLCVLPFLLPGSLDLQWATVEGLRSHRLVVWSKHGVIARSDESVTRVADLIEYAETAARYELLDRSTGGRGEGLTHDELHAIVEAFTVPTTLY